MTDKQPEALEVADDIEGYSCCTLGPKMDKAAALLRTQHKQIAAYKLLAESQEAQLSQHRAQADKCREAIATLQSERDANALLTAAIERKDALLRQALEQMGKFSAIDICETQHHKKADQHSPIAQCPVAERFRVVWFAIKQEVSQ